MRQDNMMEGVPGRVIEFQDMYQARSRVVILRQLLNRPMTFPELRGLVNMSAAALREGINDLEAAGYVTDDAPEHSKRKPSTADREGRAEVVGAKEHLRRPRRTKARIGASTSVIDAAIRAES